VINSRLSPVADGDVHRLHPLQHTHVTSSAGHAFDPLATRLESRGPVVLPALLLCDFGHLAREVERLEAAGALPAEVTLEIDTRAMPLAGRSERLRCVHRSHPRLLGGDIDRVQDAEAHMAASETVELVEFVARAAAPRQD
jgi:hypothetical protein